MEKVSFQILFYQKMLTLLEGYGVNIRLFNILWISKHIKSHYFHIR